MPIGDTLYRKYARALEVIRTAPSILRPLMQSLGTTNPAVFRKWLEEEKTYLENLKKEPIVEKIDIEYLLALKELEKLE